MWLKRTLSTVVSLCVTSCASTGDNLVLDAADQEAVPFISLTCGGEYDFSQDCSNFNGAQREILVKGIECRVAGSSDGGTILLQGIAKYLPNSDRREAEVNECYPAVKQALIENGVDLLQTIPVGKNGAVVAYIIEANPNAYSTLISIAQ
jgi:hypothetical protein